MSCCLNLPSCPSVVGPGLRLEKQNWGTVPIALSQLEVPWAAPGCSSFDPYWNRIEGGLDFSWGGGERTQLHAART